MAGVNLYNTNGMMGYSSQHMGGSTNPGSAHMTAHIWKWSYLSKKWRDTNKYPQTRGELSCRNRWIRLSMRHFLMQGRRKRRRQIWRKIRFGKPLLPLFLSPLCPCFLFSSHSWPFFFAYFHACLQNIFHMMTKTTGFRGTLVRTTDLSLYLACMRVNVCAPSLYLLYVVVN